MNIRSLSSFHKHEGMKRSARKVTQTIRRTMFILRRSHLITFCLVIHTYGGVRQRYLLKRHLLSWQTPRPFFI